MLDDRRWINLWLSILAILVTACLFGLSLLASGRLGDLIVGLASSVGAVAFWSLFLTLSLWVADSRKCAFFGKDIVRGQTRFICPDFAPPNSDGSASSPVFLVRPGDAALRSHLLPEGDTPRPDPAFTSYARPDVEAAMQLATIFEAKSNAPHVIMSDTEVLGSLSRDSLPSLTAGAICLGLTSNDLGLAYLNDPSRSLLKVEVVAGGLAFRPKNRGLYSDSPDRRYGVCIRTAIKRSDGRPSQLFYCAGLGTKGTTAAAQYLASSWSSLSRRVKRSDFVAVVSASDGSGLPDLEAIYTS